MTDVATLNVAITASDQTGKGAKAAEKRLSQVSKTAGKQAKEVEGTIGNTSKTLLRTFGRVEQATSRMFGGSAGGGLTRRLGLLSRLSSEVGAGFGEAAAAGGLFEGALGAVGVAAAGTIGVTVGVALAALKVADSWGRSAAAIGNASDIMGVSLKTMQEFAAEAERLGIDKGTATGGIGALSSTLNDARYGRNSAAMAALAKTGVGMKLKANGDVDVAAMLPALSDAFQRQTSSGDRTLANALGIPQSLIPLFRQGGSTLSANMADAGRTAPMITDDDVTVGRRLTRRHTTAEQYANREIVSRVSRYAGQGVDSAESWVIGQFSGSVSRDFKPGAERIERASHAMERAANQMAADRRGSGMSGGALHLSPQDIVDLKKTVQTEWDGHSTRQGEGIIDTILNRQASGHWGQTMAAVVNRKKQFSNINGPVSWREGRTSVDQFPARRISAKTSELVDLWLARRAAGAPSVIGDNLNYANPNYSDPKNRPWVNAMGGPTLGSGLSIHKHGTVPELQRYRPGSFGVVLPSTAPMPVKVEVHFTGNVPPGTTAKVTAGHGDSPAISVAKLGNGN